MNLIERIILIASYDLVQSYYAFKQADAAIGLGSDCAINEGPTPKGVLAAVDFIHMYTEEDPIGSLVSSIELSHEN